MLQRVWRNAIFTLSPNEIKKNRPLLFQCHLKERFCKISRYGCKMNVHTYFASHLIPAEPEEEPIEIHPKDSLFIPSADKTLFCLQFYFLT